MNRDKHQPKKERKTPEITAAAWGGNRHKRRQKNCKEMQERANAIPLPRKRGEKRKEGNTDIKIKTKPPVILLLIGGRAKKEKVPLLQRG